jgi:predicted dehydrogenase
MASIGLGGKGESDSADAGRFGDMVAICDVDQNTLGHAGTNRFAKAKRYTDFRKMLDEMGKSIDAVTVSTPDHTHTPAALMAMRMGKHCFCQKPLTRTVYEARLMGKVAREMKVATQMGNQGTASNDLRQAAAWIKAGVLGAVKEIHIWTNRPIWNQGDPRPAASEPPKYLDWNLWLGPAAERPYGFYPASMPKRPAASPAYHPFHWRGWWDFGTGALGDIGCHTMNMPFMALDLRRPLWVQAETSGHDHDGFPAWSVVTYEFAATPTQPALKMVWYDGRKLPPAKLLDGREPSKDGGILTIGEKGKMLGYGLLGITPPADVKFVHSPGHFEEWVNAIKGQGTPVSNFPDFAGPLSETVLLGNLAVWAAAQRPAGKASAVGEKLYWDSEKMAVKNAAGFESLLKPTYRKGYTLE